MGVDVFFVISGYLITKIIAAETAQGRFSIWRFYERRIRRIIPALAGMLLVVLAASALWVLPASLERVSGSALAAMLFFANVHFWSTSSNYFAPASETDPFLHTWSLAVEEQFYLIFPLLFVLIFRFGRRPLLVSMALVGMASFSLMLVAYDFAPTATFFLPVTRAWEFLVGSILAMGAVPRPKHRGLASVGALGGLALILAGAVVFDSSAAFPGQITLLPVLGTALIILCADHAAASARLPFELAPIRWIGLISYSLYLWHWPILVLAEHYILHRPLTVAEAAICIALSFAAATLFYHVVEQPFRYASALRRPGRLMAVTTPLAIAAAAFAAVSLGTGGLAMRHPGFAQVSIAPQIAAERGIQRAAYEDCFVRKIEDRQVLGCHLGPRGNPNILIWGDSFAMHYLPALARQASLLDGHGLISFASPQCPPILGYDPVNLPACKAINDRAFALIKEMKVDTVVLSANWFSYDLVHRVSVTDITDTVRRLQAQGVQVVLVGQSPIFSFTTPEEALFREVQQVGGDRMLIKAAAARNEVPDDYNSILRAQVPANLFFDPTIVFCESNNCRFHDGERYLFKDYGHVTVAGAQAVITALLKQLLDTRYTN